MASLRIEFKNGDLHLPALGLWLDAHRPVKGEERVFVSHAHSDHIARHREVILSAPTARLMQARLGGTRQEHVLPYRESRHFGRGSAACDLSLWPAGHIFGSAMVLLKAGGRSLLYTGDFRLRPGLSAEPCEPQRADILIMETTFGRPEYVFPPVAEVVEGIIRFCGEALARNEIPVLLGYSLGKSQELLCSLADSGLEVMVHESIHKVTKVFEELGQRFPAYEPFSAEGARGKVLLCPPSARESAAWARLDRTRTAVVTGWAVDQSCRYRYQCDAAFPLSDHADFPDLVEFVERIEPRKVFTVHGFATDFAETLRDLGFDAQALGQDEQLTLPLFRPARRGG